MGSEEERGKNKMEGIASIALLPSGSISGHFIHLPNSTCYGLHGTESGFGISLHSQDATFHALHITLEFAPNNIVSPTLSSELSCERECSRGEDYRLIKLSIIDYSRKKEQVVVVECRGHDAARFQNVEHAHGWEEDVVGMVQQKHGKHNISISFVCETLKADDAAEEHLKKYMPNLVGQDAVVNIGQMRISGINFEGDEESLGESSGVNLEGDEESLGESSED